MRWVLWSCEFEEFYSLSSVNSKSFLLVYGFMKFQVFSIVIFSILGSMSAGLKHLSTPKYLNLSENPLKSTIRMNMRNLTEIIQLSFVQNFTGQIADTMLILSKPQNSAYENRLTGTISPALQIGVSSIEQFDWRNTKACSLLWTCQCLFSPGINFVIYPQRPSYS